MYEEGLPHAILLCLYRITNITLFIKKLNYHG